MSVASRGFLRILCVATGLTAVAAFAQPGAEPNSRSEPGAGNEKPVVESPVVVDGAAPPVQPIAPPPRQPAADGTTSVIVPSQPDVPPARTAGEAAAVPAVGPAGELLAHAFAPPQPRPEDGPQQRPRPLPLLEALDRSGDRARRLWITQAYWKVAADFARVRWAAEAVERLELVAAGGDPHDRAALDVATAAARADLAEARAQLGGAQQELIDLTRIPAAEPPPWPADRPLVVPYQTHFETIFANRVATGRVRAIVRTLPARHEAVETRGLAIRAAEKAVAMAETDHAKGRRPIEAVIDAHRALVAQQRDFVRAVQAYNLDIAEYA
ncbi:MAG: hypothetical protein ACK5SI_05190, partial [Planctomycetia bacterium]